MQRKSSKATTRYAVRWRGPKAHPINRGSKFADGTIPENPNESPDADVRADTRRDETAPVVPGFPGSKCENVVLFLPGPVTEDDLLADRIRSARRMRRHRVRRKRTQWLEANIGILVFVIGLLALTWLVADK